MKSKLIHSLVFFSVFPFSLASAGEREYRFDGPISRPVLENYLSRSITMAGLQYFSAEWQEDARMLKHIGAKFAGRAIYMWGSEYPVSIPEANSNSPTLAQVIHAADPDIILQAGIFEIVTANVNKIPIPPWVLAEFNQPAQPRNFIYENMIFENGRWVDHWGKQSSVPDISRLETRMWYFYLAGSYIQLGFEALHLGQIMLITANDPGYQNFDALLTRIRNYAAKHARRRWVLCDGHISSGIDCYGLDSKVLSQVGIKVGDRLLLDFNALPLRIREIPDQPQKADLAVGHLDAIYNRSGGGITPSGWTCDHLPYLVEYDNWGASPAPGQSAKGKTGNLVGISDTFWVWGYDEICWFAHQSESDRNEWLKYAWNWVRKTDPNGFVQMPGLRCLAVPVNGINDYRANTKSDACPNGFNQEQTIREIWTNDK